MSLGLTIPESAQQQMLASLCAQNQSAELSYRPDDGPRMRSNVRFLALEGDTLLVEHPTVTAMSARIGVGEVVRIHFLLEGRRLTFAAGVQGRRRWSGGGATVVSALMLDVPVEIERAQRRDSYRLSLLHRPAVPVRLSPPGPPGTSPREVEGQPGNESYEPLEGTLMNLSETGAGVSLNRGMARHLSVDRLYEVCIALPGGDEEVVLPARLRWCQAKLKGERILLGIAWELDPSNPRARAIQRALARFIATQQRQTLRRTQL